MLGFIVPTLALLATAPQAPVTSWRGVSHEGLRELSARGEVVVLPAHQGTPFRAWVVSRAAEPCGRVERAMWTVERYPERWQNIREVRVLERTRDRVEYEFDIDLVFSPTLRGRIERPRRGNILFHDVETGGLFSWFLSSDEEGCLASYELFQPPGKQSGFVALVTAVERGAQDSAEISGAIASMRGYMRPEQPGASDKPLSGAAQRTWDALSAAGTVVRLERRSGQPTRVTAQRRTTRSATTVVQNLRDRQRYPKQIDIIRQARSEGRRTRWQLGYFGGNVSVATVATEEGTVGQAEGFRLHERVVAGDLPPGGWRWQVRAVEGGAEVELHIDLDITSGSLVLRSLAAQDPMIRDAAALQMALAMMGALVGGERLPLADGPPVAVRAAHPAATPGAMPGAGTP